MAGNLPDGFKEHWWSLMADACLAQSLTRLKSLFCKVAKTPELAGAYLNYCSVRDKRFSTFMI
jgi:hypothetical protein